MLAISEISNVFDQYTNYSTPYPPINGILQLTDSHRKQICQIRNDLQHKLENYYCDTNENCCNTQTLLDFLNNCKNCESDLINYSEYKKILEASEECSETQAKFYNFLENVCISIASDELSKM